MRITRDEKGSALILSILMIALLAVIGVFSTQTSTVETRIARNQKLHKMAFGEAEGGAEVGIQFLEDLTAEKTLDDLLASGGNLRKSNLSWDFGDAPPDLKDPNAVASSSNFNLRQFLPTNAAAGLPGFASSNRDFSIPRNATGAPPITNVMIAGLTDVTPGSGIEMIAGYEGEGKSAAKGGLHRLYDIRSRHQGMDNSESTVNLRYLHVIK